MELTDYQKYRGKCKEFCEKLIKERPELQLVRGFYHCPINGKEQHWWCKTEKGEIIDPTAKQFPSKGIGEYEEFNGKVQCAQCSKEMMEREAIPAGNYPVCSYICYRKLVL